MDPKDLDNIIMPIIIYSFSVVSTYIEPQSSATDRTAPTKQPKGPQHENEPIWQWAKLEPCIHPPLCIGLVVMMWRDKLEPRNLA